MRIGIRIALGASRKDVLRFVLSRGLLLIGLGIVTGVGASLALMHVLVTLLWGVTVNDPVTYVFVIIVLVSVALLACYLPARRSLRIDASIALRCD